jgi:hypothetical protein
VLRRIEAGTFQRRDEGDRAVEFLLQRGELGLQGAASGPMGGAAQAVTGGVAVAVARSGTGFLFR